MTSLAVNALFEKRNEIAGRIALLEKQMEGLRADLAHVEATIRIFQPGTALRAIAPKRIQHRARHFKGSGFLTRLVLDHIRQHPGDVVTVETALTLVIGDQQFSEQDKKRLRMTLYQTLYRIEKGGTLERIASEGRTIRWRSAGET